MKTYMVTLVSRMDVPVLAENEQEAIEKAEAVQVYSEAETSTYGWDEYTDESEANEDNRPEVTMSAQKNEDIYVAECLG